MNFLKFINSGKSRFSEYENQLKKCNRASISCIGEQEFPIYKATLNPNLSRSVYLIGCIHGNEIAGTTGLLNYLHRGEFPKNIRIEIIPLLNGHGFVNNTRNNQNDMDINRDFCQSVMQPETKSLINLFNTDKPEMIWTLHEDQSCDNFYAYYSNHDLLHLWNKMISIASDYFPIMNGEIHGDQCANGLICHPKNKIAVENPKHKCSLENAFYNNGIHYLTTETPCNSSLPRRTICYTKMLNYILNFLDNHKIDQI